jgi:site-specific DNA-methyltransferase (adenine-specific)
MKLNNIHVGDTLKTLKELPDNSIDIIVTSPPYNKNKTEGQLVKEVIYANCMDGAVEEEYQEQQREVLDELYRVTKPFGHIFYNHKVRWVMGYMIHPLEWIAKSQWDVRQEIIWDRSIAGNLRGWRFWQVEERIYWMQKGIQRGAELASRHAKMTSIWRIRPENKIKEHPAPFPIEIPTRCIYSVMNNNVSGHTINVLDPYSGSGSTLVAAKLLGCSYIGIDCSEEYVKNANERLQNITTDDRVSVSNECALHVVEKSYAERKKIKESKI